MITKSNVGGKYKDEWFIGTWNGFEYFKENFTIKDEQCFCKSYYDGDELKDCTCGKCEEKSWPQIGDAYWYLNSKGEELDENWEDLKFDREVRDFLGIYRTKDEALKARDRIKEMLNEKNVS